MRAGRGLTFRSWSMRRPTLTDVYLSDRLSGVFSVVGSL